jgi:hypothetical protein
MTKGQNTRPKISLAQLPIATASAQGWPRLWETYPGSMPTATKIAIALAA